MLGGSAVGRDNVSVILGRLSCSLDVAGIVSADALPLLPYPGGISVAGRVLFAARVCRLCSMIGSSKRASHNILRILLHYGIHTIRNFCIPLCVSMRTTLFFNICSQLCRFPEKNANQKHEMRRCKRVNPRIPAVPEASEYHTTGFVQANALHELDETASTNLAGHEGRSKVAPAEELESLVPLELEGEHGVDPCPRQTAPRRGPRSGGQTDPPASRPFQATVGDFPELAATTTSKRTRCQRRRSEVRDTLSSCSGETRRPNSSENSSDKIGKCRQEFFRNDSLSAIFRVAMKSCSVCKNLWASSNPNQQKCHRTRNGLGTAVGMQVMREPAVRSQTCSVAQPNGTRQFACSPVMPNAPGAEACSFTQPNALRRLLGGPALPQSHKRIRSVFGTSPPKLSEILRAFGLRNVPRTAAGGTMPWSVHCGCSLSHLQPS